MKNSALIHLTACFVLIVSGCSTPKPLPRAATIELHDASPITVIRSSQDSLQLSAIVTSESKSRPYSRALLLFQRADGQRDSIMMNIESSGAQQESLTTTLHCRIPQPLAADISIGTLSIGLEHGSIITFHPVLVQSPVDEALTVSPFVQHAEDGAVVFGATCTRNKLVAGEYLPSSEDLRVIVRSGFKVLWNSDLGMAFLTVITPVRPELVSQQSTYTLEWNGMDNSGLPIPSGEYTADILIPAKPEPYRTQITFTWPLSKK